MGFLKKNIFAKTNLKDFLKRPRWIWNDHQSGEDKPKPFGENNN